MALPENRIKKIKLPDNTEYNIVPEMLGKNGFSAELPTLTQNSTIALSSDVNTKIINLDLSTGIQESGEEALYIPLTEEQFNLCINKDVEVFVNVISSQSDGLSYTFKRSGIWNTRGADFYTHVANDQMSVQLTAEVIHTNSLYWFKISELEQPGSGTVTSVIAEGASGSHINVSGSPITTAGTLTFDVESGYSIPSTTQQTTWTNKYSKPSGGIPDSDLASTFVKKVNNITPDASGNVTITIPAGDNQTVKGNGTAFGANDAINIVGGGATTVTADTTNKKITISTPAEAHLGDVVSVGATANSGIQISGTTANPTVGIDSSHKLPTTTEWNNVAFTNVINDFTVIQKFQNNINVNSINTYNGEDGLSIEYDSSDGTDINTAGHFTAYGDNDTANTSKPDNIIDPEEEHDLDTDYFNTGVALRGGDDTGQVYKLSFPAKSGVFATTDDCEIPIDDLTQINS